MNNAKREQIHYSFDEYEAGALYVCGYRFKAGVIHVVAEWLLPREFRTTRALLACFEPAGLRN